MVQLVLFVLILAAFVVFPVVIDNMLRLPGLVMMLTGLGLVLVAFAEHNRVNNGGPSIFPTPHRSADLIRTGIYRRVRHPIYTGVMIAALGAALFHGHPVGVVLAALLIPFFTYKSMVEERMLQAAYPDYAAYVRRSGRFVPPLVGEKR